MFAAETRGGCEKRPPGGKKLLRRAACICFSGTILKTKKGEAFASPKKDPQLFLPR